MRPVKASVVLRLPAPISTNAIWRVFARGGRVATIKSERYRDWEKAADAMIDGQDVGRIDGPYRLEIWLPRKCRIDLDNTVKCISDAAQRAGIISNDALCRKLIVQKGIAEETICLFTEFKGESECIMELPS